MCALSRKRERGGEEGHPLHATAAAACAAAALLLLLLVVDRELNKATKKEK